MNYFLRNFHENILIHTSSKLDFIYRKQSWYYISVICWNTKYQQTLKEKQEHLKLRIYKQLKWKQPNGSCDPSALRVRLYQSSLPCIWRCKMSTAKVLLLKRMLQWVIISVKRGQTRRLRHRLYLAYLHRGGLILS